MTDPINNTRSTLTSSIDAPAGPPPPITAKRQPIASPPNVAAPFLAGFVAARTGVDAKEVATGKFFDAAAAPYLYVDAGGDLVKAHVPPNFRMNGGYGGTPAACQKKIVDAIGPDAAKSLGPAIYAVTVGKATPKQIGDVTNALVASGAFDFPKGDPKKAIQVLQWQYGVGVDCSGFVQQELMAARGDDATNPAARAKYGFAAEIWNEGLDLAHNALWKKVDPAAVRPGDAIILGPPEGEDVGHTVCVHAVKLVDPASQKAMIPIGSEAKAFLASKALVRIEVDSSWGAGPQGDIGGVLRKNWLYDPQSKTWASWDPATNQVQSVGPGPYEHPLVGVFRPKNE